VTALPADILAALRSGGWPVWTTPDESVAIVCADAPAAPDLFDTGKEAR
jgi:hypothetical protein